LVPVISYEEYHNPQPLKKHAETLEQILNADQDSKGEYWYPAPLTEHILARLSCHDNWPEDILKKRRAASEWLPEDVFDWWQAQFSHHETLDKMPREWWLTQTRNFVAARDERKGAVVGAVALTEVEWISRTRHAGQVGGTVFAEIRGLVVDSQYRRSAQHIGTQLVQKVVSIFDDFNANATGATHRLIAMTSNPAAGRLFAATGATLDPMNKGLSMTKLALVRSACWRGLGMCEIAGFCAECPQTDATQVWIWPPPTHRTL
jgi:ribosomal protein S18 acetylase RimI-like enzyme